MKASDLVVLHEHPEWQTPLFAALERRGIACEPFDLKRAAFSNVDVPRLTAGSISVPRPCAILMMEASA